MLGFFKRLFCKHTERRFIRNIYGDEINYYDGGRSLWECTHCGSVVVGDSLHNSA